MGKQKKELQKPLSRSSALKRAKRITANHKVLAKLQNEA